MAMTIGERLSYHRARASRELHIGMLTTCAAAARAHLKLSALHLEKVRELQARGKSKDQEPQDANA